MRCASYARYVSCVPEKNIPSDIIHQQNDRIQKYIKQNGWELVQKYADRKQDTEADDAFRTMQNDGVSRKFDMVVVDSLLRCGSNVSYAEDVLLKSFLPAGIHFAVVEDNVCSLTLTYEEAAAYFKKKRNAYIGGVLYSRTRAEQAQGYLSVHDEKYGYLLNEERKGFVIDEEVVPIIRKIFHMVADEKKLFREVADYLNENKIDSPMMHLVRVSQKKRGEVKSHWSPGSVKRVIDNTAYIGYWYKIMDGERTKIETPPIIEKELFDRAAKVVESRSAVQKKHPPVMKSDNAFVKQIFDKETGATVVCRLHRTENPYQTFGMDFWQRKTIRYDYVMEQTVEHLRLEQQKIEFAKEWIASDLGQLEKQRRKAVFAEQARTLFEEMAELEKVHLHYYCMSEAGEITEEEYRQYREQINAELTEKEAVFKNLMAQVDELELAFSNRNPWMVFYGNIKIPDKLTKEEIRKWIDKVLIENMETVEVVLPIKHTRWRDILPIQETEVW